MKKTLLRSLVSFFLFILCVLPGGLSAQTPPYESLPLDCEVTPSLAGDGMKYFGKDKIVASGNLARPAGKAEWAEGQLVFFTGRILDKDCAPIADAVVDIWQADSAGEYQSPNAADLLSPEALFAGSGRVVTDNLGQFRFVTVFPGPLPKRAPQVHVRVIKEGFDPLETSVYFSGDRRNEGDAALQKLSFPNQELLTARVNPVTSPEGKPAIQAQIALTLKGKNKYKRF